MKLKLVKGSKKQDRTRDGDNELENDVDGLFTLPLAEFTAARNALSSQLKKNGRGDDAALVKSLAKPPVSAWAVNQLYWNHREAFDRLLESGERFHKSQTSGKVADMRAAVDARREAITHLSDLATSTLQEAGHNPSLDIIRRINSTLEAMSIYASRSDAPRPGRLTHDVDPPGFESLASWIPSAGVTQAAEGRRRAAGTTSPQTSKLIQKLSTAPAQRKVTTDDHPYREQEKRKAKIAAAKVSLQDAKKTLAEARAKAQRLETAQKQADAEAKKVESLKRDAEEEWRKARIASEDAARRARSVAVEVGEAAKALENAERVVDKAARELESLVREGK